MKPTDEQIKEFWERVAPIEPDGYGHNWFEYNNYPPIDLNNLFKYAVPKIIGDGFTLTFEHALAEEIWCWWIIEKDDDLWKFSDKDPALALFWAIYEVIK